MTFYLWRSNDACNKGATKHKHTSSTTTSTSSKTECDLSAAVPHSVANSTQKVPCLLRNNNQTDIAHACMTCKISFDLILWRPYCRSCGYLVCDRCGASKISLKKADPYGRVCKSCYNIYLKQHPNPLWKKTTDTTDLVPLKNGNQYADVKEGDNSRPPSITSVDHTAMLFSSHSDAIKMNVQHSGNPLGRLSSKHDRRSSFFIDIESMPSVDSRDSASTLSEQSDTSATLDGDARDLFHEQQHLQQQQPLRQQQL